MPYTLGEFLNIKSAVSAGFSPDASKVLVQPNLPGTSPLYRIARAGGDLVQITSDDTYPKAGDFLDRVLRR